MASAGRGLGLGVILRDELREIRLRCVAVHCLASHLAFFEASSERVPFKRELMQIQGTVATSHILFFEDLPSNQAIGKLIDERSRQFSTATQTIKKAPPSFYVPQENFLE